jgi:multimeric flavodoxin WrbA
MKVVGINGSPRKKWNTASLLEKAIEGAASKGAETELVHLYDLDYKGCISCFACKLSSGSSYGRCVVNDGLKPVLDKLEQAQVVILGSPIYFGMVTGAMRSFLERFLFQYLVYDSNYTTLREKPMQAGVIYTMNINEEGLVARKYKQGFDAMEAPIKRNLLSKNVLSLYVTDTMQFDDYEKYGVTAFDPAEKAKRRAEEFPKDLQKAFNLGVRLVKNI